MNYKNITTSLLLTVGIVSGVQAMNMQQLGKDLADAVLDYDTTVVSNILNQVGREKKIELLHHSSALISAVLRNKQDLIKLLIDGLKGNSEYIRVLKLTDLCDVCMTALHIAVNPKRQSNTIGMVQLLLDPVVQALRISKSPELAQDFLKLLLIKPMGRNCREEDRQTVLEAAKPYRDNEAVVTYLKEAVALALAIIKSESQRTKGLSQLKAGYKTDLIVSYDSE
jgi:hypothetical protein